MKISKEYPPNYERLKGEFKLSEGVVFTYGDTIYNPDEGKIDKPLMAHEKVHCTQQGVDIEGWWDKYILDKEFRLSQELEAYQRQYRVAKNKLNREDLFRLLKYIASDLSGELYGNLIDFNKAMSLIKN